MCIWSDIEDYIQDYDWWGHCDLDQNIWESKYVCHGGYAKKI